MALGKPLLILIIIAALLWPIGHTPRRTILTPDSTTRNSVLALVRRTFDGGRLYGALAPIAAAVAMSRFASLAMMTKRSAKRNRRSHCHGCLPYGQ